MIESDRTILRPWHTDDAEALFRYASDARVSEPALWQRHTSVDMSREIIGQVFAPNPCAFAIVLKQTGEPIGCIGLVPKEDEHFETETSEREIGYWVGYPYWGMGIATEALRALIRHLHDEKGINAFMITANAENTASQRVAEKCGFLRIRRYDYGGTESVVYKLKL